MAKKRKFFSIFLDFLTIEILQKETPFCNEKWRENKCTETDEVISAVQ